MPASRTSRNGLTTIVRLRREKITQERSSCVGCGLYDWTDRHGFCHACLSWGPERRSGLASARNEVRNLQSETDQRVAKWLSRE